MELRRIREWRGTRGKGRCLAVRCFDWIGPARGTNECHKPDNILGAALVPHVPTTHAAHMGCHRLYMRVTISHHQSESGPYPGRSAQTEPLAKVEWKKGPDRCTLGASCTNTPSVRACRTKMAECWLGDHLSRPASMHLCIYASIHPSIYLFIQWSVHRPADG